MLVHHTADIMTSGPTCGASLLNARATTQLEAVTCQPCRDLVTADLIAAEDAAVVEPREAATELLEADLVTVARRASEHRPPVARLLEVAELLEQAEALKAELVAQARAEGASWQRIAHAIGGTKQAAQKRYGKVMPKAEPVDQLSIDDELQPEAATIVDDNAWQQIEEGSRTAAPFEDAATTRKLANQVHDAGQMGALCYESSPEAWISKGDPITCPACILLRRAADRGQYPECGMVDCIGLERCSFTGGNPEGLNLFYRLNR